ncbi:MAG: prepilin-type N-terminal cleavage/methylation domain-containing protein [Acidovorax sp.]
MPTSAAGNSKRSGGFTLLELLVVIAIIAIGTAGAALALRDPGQTQLEREGERLAALLESARAQSRTSGNPVYWRALPQGFRFDGLPGSGPGAWLDAHTQVLRGTDLVLGPEPLIPPQQVIIANTQTPGRALRVGTDGLHPFSVESAP